MQRKKIKNLFIASIISLLTTSLIACTDTKTVNQEIIIFEKVKALTKSTPKNLEHIEKTINFKFDESVNNDAFNIATASIKALNKTNFKSIEYRHRFQDENPLGLLILKLKNSNCISKETITNKLGKPLSKDISRVHFFSGKRGVTPYKDVLEYYIFKVNNKGLSVSFPVNPKTGVPQQSACVSGFTIDYDEYRIKPTTLSK
ncbi:MAG: hypothetical protein L3J59_11210 [Methylococcaceae bacterium]|nr:hypothetical protein [Methylococcaceae bacterium]